MSRGFHSHEGEARSVHSAEIHAHWDTLLYIGLGLYIVIKSSCYPWSIEKINHSVSTHPGKVIMSTMTVFFLLACIGLMLWFKLKKKATRPVSEPIAEETSSPTPMHAIDNPPASV